MNQVTNLIIVALVLIALIVIVMIALMKRAKNDPESLRNRIVDGMDLDVELEEYDETRKAEVFSRASRPAAPDPNDYRYWLAVMESRRRQDQLNNESIEDMELW